MTTPPPAEAPESADRTPFTIDDADAFTAKVLELRQRIDALYAEERLQNNIANAAIEAAALARQGWRDAERDLAELVGMDRFWSVR